jgi:hypothetical protein
MRFPPFRQVDAAATRQTKPAAVLRLENHRVIHGSTLVALSCLLVFFSIGTQTSRLIGVSPGGSAVRLEVPLAIASPKRVLTDRLQPSMEKKNLTARKHRELILQLLDAVNSEAEYLYLQRRLVPLEAELAGFSLSEQPKGGEEQWQTI